MCKSLATSREPLSVEGERLHHVHSLEFPPVLPGLGAAEALEYPAIQLFVERAASVLGEFEVRDIDVPIVVQFAVSLTGYR
jgi:predicted ATPase